MLTQDRLKELLEYCPESGVFLWRVRRSPHRPVGSAAGCLNSLGYVQITIDGTNHYGHRLAWLYVYGKFPDGELDHRDGNPANNRLLNLRPATRPQNTANVRRSSRNTSGYKGVSYAKDKRKWSAHIYARSRRYFLGYFATPEQAHEAYAVAAKQLHGEFANDGRDAR